MVDQTVSKVKLKKEDQVKITETTLSTDNQDVKKVSDAFFILVDNQLKH